MEHPTKYVSLQSNIKFIVTHQCIYINIIQQLQKQVVDNWTHATPVCCHFEVFADEGPNTARHLKYYLPVRGIIPEDTTLLIHRRLQTTGKAPQTSYDSLIITCMICNLFSLIFPLPTHSVSHTNTTPDPVIQYADPPKHDRASVPVSLESPPKIVDLLKQVAVKVSVKWRMLGHELGIEVHELDKLEHLQQKDDVHRLERMFILWKNKAVPPYTWGTVIDALKSPLVEESSVAEDVEMWLSQRTV